jgi:hypothetical protein
MLRETFAAEGRKTVLSRFTADCMVEGTLAAYRNILSTYHRALKAGTTRG